MTISDPIGYVTGVLSHEAPDISPDAIKRFPWQVDDLRLDKLRVDTAMLARHDRESIHVKRRDLFVTSIIAGRPIAPLIALGGDLILVDGFSRYRALTKLDVDHGPVLRQVIEG
jgi:hypothetical protein